MDQTTHEVRLEQWVSIISQCQNRPEGQTAKEWLRENGISEKSYYYWLRKIRRKAYDDMTQELPACSGSILASRIMAGQSLISSMISRLENA